MQPSVFISHGAPNILLRDNSFTRALRDLGDSLLRPRGIVVFSAHWESLNLTLTVGSPGPELSYETIHDFYGFERDLYRISYPGYGSAELVDAVAGALVSAGLPILPDARRGLDHGTWVPLLLMWDRPPAPLVQVSIDPYAPPEEQLRIGRAVAALRAQDILVIGSGGTVHNLGIVEPEDSPTRAWAVEFDDWLLDRLTAGDLDSLCHYRELAPHAALAVPRAEHFVNFFLALGAAVEGAGDRAAPRGGTAAGGIAAPAPPEVLNRSYLFGCLSMLTLRWS